LATSHLEANRKGLEPFNYTLRRPVGTFEIHMIGRHGQ